MIFSGFAKMAARLCEQAKKVPLLAAALLLTLASPPAALTAVPKSEASPLAVIPAPPPPTAVLPANPNPPLWVMKDDDTIIYLFGTIHFLKPDVDWFDDLIKVSFDQSDELVLEVEDLSPAETLTLVRQLAIDQSGKSLRSKLSPETRAAYEAVLNTLGLPLESFDPNKPWFAATNLSLIPLIKDGYRQDIGAEAVLRSAARAAGKPVIALETTEQQLRLFDSLPADTQLSYLELTVKSAAQLVYSTDQALVHWARGDTDGLARWVIDGIGDEITYNVLLRNRNADWADQLSVRMTKPGTVFVAVGAGHLIGRDSVQKMLIERGFKVERIVY
jgi:hypothetical protein